jgi:hypothetical protein
MMSGIMHLNLVIFSLLTEKQSIESVAKTQKGAKGKTRMKNNVYESRRFLAGARNDRPIWGKLEGAAAIRPGESPLLPSPEHN